MLFRHRFVVCFFLVLYIIILHTSACMCVCKRALAYTRTRTLTRLIHTATHNCNLDLPATAFVCSKHRSNRKQVVSESQESSKHNCSKQLKSCASLVLAPEPHRHAKYNECHTWNRSHGARSIHRNTDIKLIYIHILCDYDIPYSRRDIALPRHKTAINPNEIGMLQEATRNGGVRISNGSFDDRTIPRLVYRISCASSVAHTYPGSQPHPRHPGVPLGGCPTTFPA